MSQTSGTTTLHIFTPDGMLVGSIEGNGTATSTRFVHPDHLGSTNMVTRSSGYMVQTLDYWPFGNARSQSHLWYSCRRQCLHGLMCTQPPFLCSAGSDLMYLPPPYRFGICLLHHTLWA